MGWLSGKNKSNRKTEDAPKDAPMTPEQLEKLYPDCIAKMKDKWKAEQQAAPDPEDGNGDGGGDGGNGEPVDPPPSTEPEAEAKTPGSESRATQSRATQQTPGSESRATKNDESAEAGTGATVAAGGASARFVSQEVGTMANESNKAGADKPGDGGKAASLADLRTRFPGDANAAFVLDCVEKGLTMTQALDARCTALEGGLKAAGDREAQIREDMAKLRPEAKAQGGGVLRAASLPREAAGGAGGDKEAAHREYYERVAEEMRVIDPKTNQPTHRHLAIHRVNQKYPDLRERIFGGGR